IPTPDRFLIVPDGAHLRCSIIITSVVPSTRMVSDVEFELRSNAGPRKFHLFTFIRIDAHAFDAGGPSLVKIIQESHSVPRISAALACFISVIIFIGAHLAFLTGVETPDKFVFDEFHYVPAARQMLLPVMPEPMLNPMHPPLAKQIIAFSIRTFGDN